MIIDQTQNMMTGLGTTGGGELSNISASGAYKFPNPFFDIASEYIPRDLRQVFEFAEYMFLTCGTYRSAARKVVRYFLTEIIIEGESEDEREEYKNFLDNELHLMTQLADIGDDYMCFHGDTKAVTKNGIFSLRELTGKTVEVLTKDGVYRKAEFKSFGRQALMEVEFSDGRTVLATPEHEWHVRKSTGGTTKVNTTELTGRYIERTVAPRPVKDNEFKEGVRHGFVFGDGSVYNKTRLQPHSVANFFDSKDEIMKSYFEGYGADPVTSLNGRLSKIHGLPEHYKLLPDNNKSAEYWYGFICGFIAADGTVDTYGCTMLTQASKATLEVIAEQLPRIGMVAGPIRGQDRTTSFDRPDGSIDEYNSTIYYMTLLKQFMVPEDILLPSHLTKFLANECISNYGKYIRVNTVKETGIVDDVFCCVEPETHTFVIDNGILTGNCYGNVFVSLYFPFDRYLICPQCHTEYHVDTMKYKFSLKDKSFECECKSPDCKFKGKFDRQDRRSMDRKRLRLKRWNPKLIRLRYHHISGEIEYYMELEPIFMKKLEDGNPFYINRTPWEILECAASSKSGEVPLFRFDPKSIYHLHESTLAGLYIRGWGIPPIMPNFKLAYYIQVLRRYDEAIAFDFIVPYRVMYPDLGASAGTSGIDALQATQMALFNANLQQMIASHRKNITDIQASPFKIGYQMIGGEAKSLAPKENIALALDELLNAVGFPAELYKGTLQIQAMPVALRLFEKSWGTLVDGYNDLVSWIIASISKNFNWGDVTGTLRSVTLADDVERKALALQAAAGMDISKGTAYRPLGIDFMEEQRKVIDEQKKIMELQQDAQEEQEIGGGQEGGGGQAGAAEAAGATPGDVAAQGKQIAEQLLLQTPESLRRGELIKIKHSNPTLHAIVMQEMNNMRQEMSSQGQAAMLEQAKQQSGGTKVAELQELFKQLPTPLGISVLIAEQLNECDRPYMKKLAMDIKRNIKGARKAFSFVYRAQMGWDGNNE